MGNYMLPISGEDIFVGAMESLVDLYPTLALIIPRRERGRKVGAIHLPTLRYRTLRQAHILEPQATCVSRAHCMCKASRSTYISTGTCRKHELANEFTAEGCVRDGACLLSWGSWISETYHNDLHDWYHTPVVRVALAGRGTKSAGFGNPCLMDGCLEGLWLRMISRPAKSARTDMRGSNECSARGE
jgi:hypothetical protein